MSHGTSSRLGIEKTDHLRKYVKKDEAVLLVGPKGMKIKRFLEEQKCRRNVRRMGCFLTYVQF